MQEHLFCSKTASVQKQPLQPPEVVHKKAVLKSFAILTEKHRCFPVNIMKFSRITILKNICEQLLLSIFQWTLPKKSFRIFPQLNSYWKYNVHGLYKNKYISFLLPRTSFADILKSVLSPVYTILKMRKLYLWKIFITLIQYIANIS